MTKIINKFELDMIKTWEDMWERETTSYNVESDRNLLKKLEKLSEIDISIDDLKVLGNIRLLKRKLYKLTQIIKEVE